MLLLSSVPLFRIPICDLTEAPSMMQWAFASSGGMLGFWVARSRAHVYLPLIWISKKTWYPLCYIARWCLASTLIVDEDDTRLDSCWNSGVQDTVPPQLVVLLEYQHFSVSTDNFWVKWWEAVAIHGLDFSWCVPILYIIYMFHCIHIQDSHITIALGTYLPT
jgi:hypothetical protein